jgi:hypothetical protein
MGPVSLLDDRQQKVGFTATAWMAVLGEKLGMDLCFNQPLCCELGQEPFFLGAVVLLNSVDDYAKGCYALTAWDTYGLRPYVNWAWDVCGILVELPL